MTTPGIFISDLSKVLGLTYKLIVLCNCFDTRQLNLDDKLS